MRGKRTVQDHVPAARREARVGPDETAARRTGGEHDYARIERAIRFLLDNHRAQPSLAEAAASVNLSPFHFQRLFTRWVGLSPKKFVQYLSLDYAKARLADSCSVLDAAYDAGLSGPSRLHDLFVAHEAVTPGEFKRRGAGLVIRYGFHASPFGECLVLATARGVCGLAFVVDGRARAPTRSEDRVGNPRAATLADMTARWPRAAFEHDPAATRRLARRAFAPRRGGGAPLRLVLYGTPFQIRVWEALLRVPPGALVSYEGVARRIGAPGAARAVGAALARNPIAYLIPCHRAIRKHGAVHDYAWGRPRKLAMIGWEAARAEKAATGPPVTP